MTKRMIALIAASVFATGALAAEHMQDTTSYDKQFNKLDKNHDGKISKEEAGKTLKKDWSQADANSDGNIDKSEFSAFEATKAATKSSKHPSAE